MKKIVTAMVIYETAWRLVEPFLAKFSRMSAGFKQRRLIPRPDPADIWIQAASAGEAYLAIALVQSLKPRRPVRILVTSGTDQGIEILRKGFGDPTLYSHHITLYCRYFPFDRPSLMLEAVGAIGPKIVVLLETELWPGLLYALKKNAVKSVIINGRLSPRSLKLYRLLKCLWLHMPPQLVLAVSKEDADRFSILFGKRSTIKRMHNMKFDRIPGNSSEVMNDGFFPESKDSLVVLGSVREEEEPQVIHIVLKLRKICPGAVVAIFPRHMHRVKFWADLLKKHQTAFWLRSHIDKLPRTDAVILWDVFGELQHAYWHADAVFVGGTLSPLGGQNFMEAATTGIRPVIGPFWDNFKWVGKTFFSLDLAVTGKTWDEVATLLIQDIKSRKDSSDRIQFKKRALSYISKRRGGTLLAADAIASFL